MTIFRTNMCITNGILKTITNQSHSTLHLVFFLRFSGLFCQQRGLRIDISFFKSRWRGQNALTYTAGMLSEVWVGHVGVRPKSPIHEARLLFLPVLSHKLLGRPPVAAPSHLLARLGEGGGGLWRWLPEGTEGPGVVTDWRKHEEGGQVVCMMGLFTELKRQNSVRRAT